ncbi:hypothetical protein H6G54_02175 [Anabaena cylindrica FACHB-243]|uniref:hypothetical protein n=1 Tax=Anabaena TaxID=1163 RepID=UPI00030938FE|nr:MULTISPECIES: hypothetical protein [Anabaena]MBD2416537.1 hypothetical protein [Anabaena cylindrica FACHB-243]MCM2407475.1 hypothetical protein [Anabaena sp. CCAP 1446/1C]
MISKKLRITNYELRITHYPLRELHKKDDPILWDGHLARPYIISGQDARTTRNFGIFF